MTSSKDARQLVTRVTAQGWKVEKTRGGHLKFTSPSGEVAFFSSSPGDVRAMKNFLSVLSRQGFKK